MDFLVIRPPVTMVTVNWSHRGSSTENKYSNRPYDTVSLSLQCGNTMLCLLGRPDRAFRTMSSLLLQVVCVRRCTPPPSGESVWRHRLDPITCWRLAGRHIVTCLHSTPVFLFHHPALHSRLVTGASLEMLVMCSNIILGHSRPHWVISSTPPSDSYGSHSARRSRGVADMSSAYTDEIPVNTQKKGVLVKI